jgi:beta-1,4-N-acetylglucosaminyltransferase
MKICIVSSCGGHLTEIRRLRNVYAGYEHFYVINDRILLAEDMKDKTYFIAHAERDLRVLKNVWEAIRILRRERPDMILSTGAGPVVPFAIIGRLFFGTRVVFIETITRISKPSMTGRLMYPIAHAFYYQWPQLRRWFPKATFTGPL